MPTAYKKRTTTKPAANGVDRKGFVLDRSGSMGMILDQVISLFNEQLATERRTSPQSLVTLVSFENVVTPVFDAQPIAQVEPLTHATYQPGGATALYDAIGRTIALLAAQATPADRVVVIILTDGAENASREYNRTRIFDLIAEHTARGNWTFVYLGANQDAYLAGGAIGVPAGNIRPWQSTAHGTQVVSDVLVGSTASYNSSAARSSNTYFAPAQPVADDADAEPSTP